jgi:hypothetical protein
LRHYDTSRKEEVSSSDVIFSNLPNPSSHTMPCGFTQPLKEMSTRNRKEKCFWGVEPAGA